MKSFLYILMIALVPMGMMIPEAKADSYYRWYSDGNCYEATSGGTVIGQVSKDLCRDSEGSRTQWFSDGNCYETTHNGTVIGQVSRDRCRQSEGSRVQWFTDGNCYETTRNGTVIGQVSRDRCRNSPHASLNMNDVVAQLAAYQTNSPASVNTQSKAVKLTPAVYAPSEQTKPEDATAGTAI